MPTHVTIFLRLSLSSLSKQGRIIVGSLSNMQILPNAQDNYRKFFKSDGFPLNTSSACPFEGLLSPHRNQTLLRGRLSPPNIEFMRFDLTDSEAEALAKELAGIIESARYPMSPRVQTLRTILSKLRPSQRASRPYHHGRATAPRQRADMEGAGEGLYRSTDDPRQRRSGARHAHRVVQVMSAPGRARPLGNGGALRCRYARPRMA
jgi:hypothetical protein